MKTQENYRPELASISDFDAILNMYRQANKTLLARGIVQWDDEYPSPVTLRENLLGETTWIFRQDSLPIASITLDEEQDPQYEFIRWAYPSDRALIVHRLCVSPEFQQFGLGRKLMEFAEVHAGVYKYEVIRLDAFLGNPYSQKLYRSLGYQEAAGYCYYPPGNIMCNCFEKWVAW